jgi:rRNA-processing protein EBP2
LKSPWKSSRYSHQTQELGVPTQRPTDYFAEMVKTDDQMMRIRKRLLDEKQGMEASENAKKQRMLKKFGKKVQVEKIVQRQMQKTKNMEKIKSFKADQNDEFDLSTVSDKKKDGKFDKKDNKSFAKNHKRDGKNSR